MEFEPLLRKAEDVEPSRVGERLFHVRRFRIDTVGIVFRQFRVDEFGDLFLRRGRIFEDIGFGEKFSGFEIGVEVFVRSVSVRSAGEPVVRNGHARESAVRGLFEVREHGVLSGPFANRRHFREFGFEFREFRTEKLHYRIVDSRDSRFRVADVQVEARSVAVVMLGIGRHGLAEFD